MSHRFSLAILLGVFFSSVAFSQNTMLWPIENQPWVQTWGASSQASSPPAQIVYEHFNAPEIAGQSVRQNLHVSIGGERVRIHLSNEYGREPITIGAASVALSATGAAIQPGTAHQISFGGITGVVIPPGAAVASDPIDFYIAPLSDLSVSIFLPEKTTINTIHQSAMQDSYVSMEGDFTAQGKMPIALTLTIRPLLFGVDVITANPAEVIVAVGDSITDGERSTPNTNHRWTDYLSERLARTFGLQKPTGIVNAGISGNQILRDGEGPSALNRFDRDVLSVPGIKYIILLEGINDILGWPGTKFDGEAWVKDKDAHAQSADEIIAGYKQIIARAHAANLKIYGGTLTPFGNSENLSKFEYYSPLKEKMRQEVNRWIRSSGEFDAVIDFELAISSPHDPNKMQSKYEGDIVHPNDAGNKAMADAVDLSLFK